MPQHSQVARKTQQVATKLSNPQRTATVKAKLDDFPSKPKFMELWQWCIDALPHSSHALRLGLLNKHIIRTRRTPSHTPTPTHPHPHTHVTHHTAPAPALSLLALALAQRLACSHSGSLPAAPESRQGKKCTTCSVCVCASVCVCMHIARRWLCACGILAHFYIISTLLPRARIYLFWLFCPLFYFSFFFWFSVVFALPHAPRPCRTTPAYCH